MSAVPLLNFYFLLSLVMRCSNISTICYLHVKLRAAPQDDHGAVQLNLAHMAVSCLTPMRDVCEIAAYISRIADRGEVDDINYANLEAILHKRLIYKATVPGKWGEHCSSGSKKKAAE